MRIATAAALAACIVVLSPAKPALAGHTTHRVHPMVAALGIGLLHMLGDIRETAPWSWCQVPPSRAQQTPQWWQQCRGKTSLPYTTNTGMASWYGGRGGGMTAAHRTLPFGSRVEVTNTRNGRSVTVTINDRGPFIRGRIIDVSIAAARALGMIGSGTCPVRLAVL
jgi:hypothetical protein